MGILVENCAALQVLEYGYLAAPLRIPHPGLPKLKQFVLRDSCVSKDVELIGDRLPALEHFVATSEIDADNFSIHQLHGVLTLPQMNAAALHLFGLAANPTISRLWVVGTGP